VTLPARIRGFEAADLGSLAVLMRDCLAMPDLDERAIARDILLVQNFIPDHLLVAEVADRPIGFLWAPRRDPLAAPERGWIAAFGVAPAHRRGGVGSALVARALAAMTEEGIAQVDVSDVPVRYWLPGVDRAACPGAFELLARHGFAEREQVASMGVKLDRDFPVDASIRPMEFGELPGLRAFFDGWEAGWLAHFERSTLQKLVGDPTPSGILGYWQQGIPLGFCHFRGSRFGPLAVSPTARGRGIGAALTLATLAAMRQAGLSEAYFLVGRPEVQPFYTRLGFTVLRRFSQLRRVFPRPERDDPARPRASAPAAARSRGA
jgi:GNAT superfamily N-acetyltransferase